MSALKILLISPEVAPFAKTGGLADVAGALPLALGLLGCNVKVFLPYYREAKKKDFGIKLIKEDEVVRLGGKDIIFSLYHCERKGSEFYFVKKDEYFDRDYLYGTPQGDYPDNAVRFAFFVRAVLNSVMKIKFKPDVIHSSDWQTALLPFYLRYKPEYTEFFKKTKTLFTIHNLAYQGLFAKDVMPEIDVGADFFTPESLEFYGKFSFIKSGILYSNAVSTVSKGYAREILTKEYGCGLEGVLNVRKNNLYGILNGADYSDWNPKTDRFIKANYDEKNLKNKTENKKDLLSEMKLEAATEKPLLGVISRLADQKGIDIIAASAGRINRMGCNLVILGTGDERYHKLLTSLAKKYERNIAVKIAFDNPLAHRIEAGCDMFLIPSRYEPCGLNQMYSLKYGTIPVVRATGGLDDTIIDYTQNPNNGNGFKFNQANADDFIGVLKRAVSVYKKKEEWRKLVIKGMKLDFSWRRSAKEYIEVYKQIAGI